MKQKNLIQTILILAFAVIIFSCTNSKNQEDQQKTDQVVADSTNVSKSAIATFQCPMKCEGEKTYTKAGKCPECDMDLAKIE